MTARPSKVAWPYLKAGGCDVIASLPFEVTDAEVGEVGEETVDLGVIEKYPHEFIGVAHRFREFVGA